MISRVHAIIRSRCVLTMISRVHSHLTGGRHVHNHQQQHYAARASLLQGDLPGAFGDGLSVSQRFGSQRQGKARRFSGKYSWSLMHLLARLEKAGFIVTEIKGDHGERILVIATVEEVLREV